MTNQIIHNEPTPQCAPVSCFSPPNLPDPLRGRQENNLETSPLPSSARTPDRRPVLLGFNDTRSSTHPASDPIKPAALKHCDSNRLKQLSRPRIFTPKADLDTTVAFGQTVKRKDTVKAMSKNPVLIKHCEEKENVPPTDNGILTPVLDEREKLSKLPTGRKRSTAPIVVELTRQSKSALSIQDQDDSMRTVVDELKDAKNEIHELREIILQQSQSVADLKHIVDDQIKVNKKLAEQVNQLQLTLTHNTINERELHSINKHNARPVNTSTPIDKRLRRIQESELSNPNNHCESIVNDCKNDELELSIDDNDDFSSEPCSPDAANQLSMLRREAQLNKDEQFQNAINDLCMRFLPDSKLVSLSQRRDGKHKQKQKHHCVTEALPHHQRANNIEMHRRQDLPTTASCPSFYSNLQTVPTCQCYKCTTPDHYCNNRAQTSRYQYMSQFDDGRSIINRATFVSVHERREQPMPLTYGIDNTPPNNPGSLSISSEQYLKRHQISSDPIKRTKK